jgi:hypothetical protein
VLQKRYGPGGRFNISQAEQDRFITILLNAVQSTIAFGYGSGDALNLEARLHYADTAVVALPGDNCNTGESSAAEVVKASIKKNDTASLLPGAVQLCLLGVYPGIRWVYSGIVHDCFLWKECPHTELDAVSSMGSYASMTMCASPNRSFVYFLGLV